MKMFCETELELKIIGFEQMVADRKMKGAKRINQVALSVYKDALKILREDKALQEAWRCEVATRKIVDGTASFTQMKCGNWILSCRRENMETITISRESRAEGLIEVAEWVGGSNSGKLD